MNHIKKTFTYGDHTVTLETGQIARQATSSVIVRMDNTVVLVTVVAVKNANEDADFFPLSVHYQEKNYATGKIPGGFFKREGRPSEKETLTSRLIDRPIRPLFANGFNNEVQVIATVLSADKSYDPDIATMIGTSAALCISGLPFNGPIGAARVGFSHEKGYILNPSYQALEHSALDMVVAGTKNAVIMVESEAQELTEDQMLGAVLFASQEMQSVITAINEFAAEVTFETFEWHPPVENTSLADEIKSKFNDDIKSAYQITDKLERYKKLNELRAQACDQLVNEESADLSKAKVIAAFNKLEKQQVRENVLNDGKRIDGRDTKTVRPISVDVDILPKTHGSALFTRGETQAIVVATLGSPQDAQIIDSLEGERKDNFLLHYNFPPYCVGEAGFLGGPKRREIGHGRLARRGVQSVLPSAEEFPYTIRVVSEITESNGSSSMASVCGSSLALMDAGVPIRSAVAGVAMGLVKEDEKFAVLTDILGDEDHLGDMDFKVAGTDKGVTALQMDIKIEGINEEIMEIALNQAHDARLHILGEMNKVISQPRPEVSKNAPYTQTIKVHTDKIRDIIGKGGATIRALCEETNAAIDIDDNGLVRIYGEDKAASDLALKRIEELTMDVEVGKMYSGKVARIVDFGAFVSLPGGKDGLLHISQISEERVNKVTDYLEVGQDVNVLVLDVDNRGRIKLSMKEINKENSTPAEA